jgi:hypothetical protein
VADRARHGGGVAGNTAAVGADFRPLVPPARIYRAVADTHCLGHADRWTRHFLRRPARADDALSWVPLAVAGLLFALGFVGIAYSFYPYLIADRLDIWQAAASPEALSIILIGTIFVLPVILGYSILAHWIFRGKAAQLTYY